MLLREVNGRIDLIIASAYCRLMCGPPASVDATHWSGAGTAQFYTSVELDYSIRVVCLDSERHGMIRCSGSSSLAQR